jgi:hypothetical protein
MYFARSEYHVSLFGMFDESRNGAASGHTRHR